MDGSFLPAVTPAEETRAKRYFWTNREIEIVRQHYPAGGVEACLALLPNRTRSGVYQQAANMGLQSPVTHKPFRERWTTSPQIDEAIRRVYQSENISKGAVNHLADTLGRPRWWVKKRAMLLGFVAPRFKEDPWSAAEIEILENNSHKRPENIQKILKARGFKRTATGIVVKLKRLDADRLDPDHFTANGLAKVLGVDPKVVTRWIEKLGLKAKRRGTERVEQQGGDQWWIHRRDIRRFIGENPAAIDLRKITDRAWFIDLLVNGG